MNRRSLLGFLFAAPLAAKAALAQDGTIRALVNMPGPTFAPPVPMVLTRPVHPDMLWPGMKSWWGYGPPSDDEGPSFVARDESA